MHLAQQAQAIEPFDLWCWLLSEVRLALEPITPAGHISDSQRVRETIELAATRMHQLEREDVTSFADKLIAHLDELVSPIEWLESTLAPWQTSLSPADETFITWVWQHRHALNIPQDEAFPARLHSVAHDFWQVLALFHRASSLAEVLHSWVRPFLQIHRGMPQWLGPLLQLFWNHHRFQRGKRAGKTPIELAGITDAPSFRQAFSNLFDNLEAISAMT